jgi:methylmalonyl-CoA mutase, N-terminal domain
VRIACDCVGFAIDNGIPGAAMTICSNHYDVAGAGPTLAVALAFANAIVYVDELVGRGYDVPAVCEKLMFFFNERSDFFVEAAIFRSAREIWSTILARRYGLAAADQPVMRLMGYAHGLETSQEPMVNIPRITLSVLASVMGGADYLCATGYDEALRIPSVDSAALALRTMQIVGHEHGVASSVDPLAGSVKLHDVEDYVSSTVWQELDRLEEQGGALSALQSGYIKQLIDENRGAREEQIASGERTMVGHSAYRADAHRDLFSGRSSGEVDFAQVEAQLCERIAEHKAQRSDQAVGIALKDVEGAAADGSNLVPPTIAALEAGATGEELVRSTRDGFRR